MESLNEHKANSRNTTILSSRTDENTKVRGALQSYCDGVENTKTLVPLKSGRPNISTSVSLWV